MSVAERVHLFLSAGRGPRECAWAIAQMLRRLEADAGRHGLTTDRVETVAGDRPGTFRSALVRVGHVVSERPHQAAVAGQRDPVQRSHRAGIVQRGPLSRSSSRTSPP